jgi:hypothetical protein
MQNEIQQIMQDGECRMMNEAQGNACLHSSFCIHHSALTPTSHAVEGGSAAAAATPAISTSLATLLTSHILQDGEIVLLILKPSLWYMLLSGLRFFGVVLFLMIAATLWDERMPGKNIVYVDVGIFLMAGRMMWAILQWMGHVYVLTDRRILTLAGVFSIDVFDCPLRKVARTRILHTAAERILRLGTIQIIPQHDELPDGLWQMIAHPMEVHESVVAAINRTKQGGLL